HRDNVREIAHRRAAVFILDGDAENSEVAHLAPQVRRKRVRPVDLRGTRRDLVRGELPDAVAQHVDRFAMMEVERGEAWHRHSLVDGHRESRRTGYFT